MSLLEQETQYIKFFIDVMRSAGLLEGESFSKQQFVEIGSREGLHPFEAEKALRLAQEHDWIERPNVKEFILLEAGFKAVTETA